MPVDNSVDKQAVVYFSGEFNENALQLGWPHGGKYPRWFTFQKDLPSLKPILTHNENTHMPVDNSVDNY
jgi:hypothetical protein